MTRKKRRLRGEPDVDPDFQRELVSGPHLDNDAVDRAYRHGFDARDRFADRPFYEVEAYLHESWQALAPDVPWADACGFVRAGYERFRGAGFAASTDLAPEALERFPERTAGGSMFGGGTMGDTTLMGGAYRASEFEGEGGRPVGGEGSEEAAGGQAGSAER